MQRLEKTRAFLTEFIIVIFFFIISVTIVVQLFTSANKKSTESMQVTKACFNAEDVAEQFKAKVDESGVEAVLCELGYEKGDAKSVYYKYFDKNFEAVNADDAYILGVVEVDFISSEKGRLYTAKISYETSEEIIFDMSTSTYVKEGLQ